MKYSLCSEKKIVLQGTLSWVYNPKNQKKIDAWNEKNGSCLWIIIISILVLSVSFLMIVMYKSTGNMQVHYQLYQKSRVFVEVETTFSWYELQVK